MQATGGPDVLSIATEPTPVPGPGEVLIKVAACGVNRPDVLQRQGVYPPPLNAASPHLGLEVSGTIVQLGDRDPGRVCSSFGVGSEVCVLVNGGGYAEYVVAHLSHCMPIPLGLSLIDAAGLPEVFMTVWSNLIDRCGLRGGESLLVHGGTSGIGTAAIQLANALNVRVFTTVGSPAKAEAALNLGAAEAFLYQEDDWADQVLEHTRGKGVHVILDMVAGRYMDKNISCLADDGRLCIIALLGGRTALIDGAQVLMRRLTITGSTLRPRSVQFKANLSAALVRHVWPLIAQGRIRPVMAARFPLEDVAAAHRMMEADQNIGKILLTVGDAA